MTIDINFNDFTTKILTNKRATSSSKKTYEEFGDFTVNVSMSEVWSEEIDADPATAVADGVAQQYNLFSLTEDITVANQQAYYADNSGRLKDWISDKYGTNYGVNIYDGNNNQIFATDPSGPFFNHQTGILTFENSTSGFTKPFKISGYRYIGAKGTIYRPDIDGVPANNQLTVWTGSNTISGIDDIEWNETESRLETVPSKYFVSHVDDNSYQDCGFTFANAPAGTGLSFRSDALYSQNGLYINYAGVNMMHFNQSGGGFITVEAPYMILRSGATFGVNDHVVDGEGGIRLYRNSGLGNTSYLRTMTNVPGTVAQLLLSTSSFTGRQFLLVEDLYRRKNFDHPVQDNPTLFIHSATNPDTDDSEWIGITHDQTNGVITTGTGNLYLNPADNVEINGNLTVNEVLAIKKDAATENIVLDAQVVDTLTVYTEDGITLGNVKAKILQANQHVVLAEVSSSTTPDSGLGKVYLKTDDKLYFKNDLGIEYDLTNRAGDVDGGSFLDTYENTSDIDGGTF